MEEERSHRGQRPVMHSIALLMAVAFAWQCCADGIAMVEAIRGGSLPRIAQRAIVERSVRETVRVARREREVPAEVRGEPNRVLRAAGVESTRSDSQPFVSTLRAELMNLPPPVRA